MLLSPQKGSQIIISSERTINDNLLLLVCRPSQAYDRDCRLVVINTLEEIADIRFGDPPRPAAADYYNSILYHEAFGLAPVENVRYRMKRLQNRYYPVWIDRDVAMVADQLRAFHADYAHGCETAKMDRTAICGLVDQYVTWVTN